MRTAESRKYDNGSSATVLEATVNTTAQGNLSWHYQRNYSLEQAGKSGEDSITLLSRERRTRYDNGTAITKSDAGAFALSLLKQYYKVTDLKVTDDKPQSDGSERLTWNSASKGIDGESFFETRGTEPGTSVGGVLERITCRVDTHPDLRGVGVG